MNALLAAAVRMKSPEAFRTISEVAEGLALPQHVLRFWESKFQQIRPLKRGGGRRYYRPEDVVLINSIKDLLYNQGFTIRGVQKLLKENSRFPSARSMVPDPQVPVSVSASMASTSAHSGRPSLWHRAFHPRKSVSWNRFWANSKPCANCCARAAFKKQFSFKQNLTPATLCAASQVCVHKSVEALAWTKGGCPICFRRRRNGMRRLSGHDGDYFAKLPF